MFPDEIMCIRIRLYGYDDFFEQIVDLTVNIFKSAALLKPYEKEDANPALIILSEE
jgi:hypothetical protein